MNNVTNIDLLTSQVALMDQLHCHLLDSSMEIACQEYLAIHHLMNSYFNSLKVQIIKYQFIR